MTILELAYQKLRYELACTIRHAAEALQYLETSSYLKAEYAIQAVGRHSECVQTIHETIQEQKDNEQTEKRD